MVTSFLMLSPSVWLATVILGRDISLSLAAFYYRYASLPAPKTLARYWDFSLPSAEVHPTFISKLNTFLQLGLIGATTALPLVTELGWDVAAPMAALQWVVLGTTVWSGGTYVWRGDRVVILGSDEALKRKQGVRGRVILGSSFLTFLVIAGILGKRGEKHGDEQVAEEK
jgi:cardiolipin synthase (CMP-forming)